MIRQKIYFLHTNFLIEFSGAPNDFLGVIYPLHQRHPQPKLLGSFRIFRQHPQIFQYPLVADSSICLVHLIVDGFHVIQNVRYVFFSRQFLQSFPIAKSAGVQANVDPTLCSFIDERSDKVCMSQHLPTAYGDAAAGVVVKPFVLFSSRQDLVYGHFFCHRTQRLSIAFLCTFKTNIACISIYMDSLFRIK